MKHWRMEDLPWERFDASKVQPDLIPLIKTAAMGERNGTEYALYLNSVFRDDAGVRQAADAWAEAGDSSPGDPSFAAKRQLALAKLRSGGG